MARVQHYDVAEPETYKIGEAPGAGIYRCIEIPAFIVVLDDDSDLLPQYPSHPIDQPVKISYRRVVRHRTPHWLRVHRSRTQTESVSAN